MCVSLALHIKLLPRAKLRQLVKIPSFVKYKGSVYDTGTLIKGAVLHTDPLYFVLFTTATTLVRLTVLILGVYITCCHTGILLLPFIITLLSGSCASHLTLYPS